MDDYEIDNADEADDSIGSRIKRLREEKGITRRTLAISAGISDNAIFKLEQRGGSPSFRTGLLIARALDTDPWIVAFGDGLPGAKDGIMGAARMARLEETVEMLRAEIDKLLQRDKESG